MSVPAFIDVGEDEQAAELRSYIQKLGAKLSDTPSQDGGGLTAGISEIVEASDILLKSDRDLAEAEAAYNSLLTLVFMVPYEEAGEMVENVCKKLSDTKGGDKITAMRVRLLQNFLFGLGDSNPHCYMVYSHLIQLAGATNFIASIPTDLKQVETWCRAWRVGMEKIQALYRLLHDAFDQCGEGAKAAAVVLALLGMYTDENASLARDDAINCIVATIKDPNMLVLDHLLPLKPVQFLRGEPIHDLLLIFVSGTLQDYNEFYRNRKDFVLKVGLDHHANLTKMRILTFLSMCEGAKEVQFDAIRERLDFTDDQDVEPFVISAVRTGKVRARMDRIKRRVTVSYAERRKFGRDEWQSILTALDHWRTNILKVRADLHKLIDPQRSGGTGNYSN